MNIFSNFIFINLNNINLSKIKQGKININKKGGDILSPFVLSIFKYSYYIVEADISDINLFKAEFSFFLADL